MSILLVGLGNPGDQYAKTRHNAGFWLLDSLAEHYGGHWREEKKFFGQCSKIVLGQQNLYLLKPQTFMNASGRSVAAIANFYQIAPEQILVAHDELDLPEGSSKLKFGGGHGGHNGLRDIISALGSKDFYRLRLGIGHPSERSEVIHYVLKPPSKAGQALLEAALIRAERALVRFCQEGAEAAMHWLHSQKY